MCYALPLIRCIFEVDRVALPWEGSLEPPTSSALGGVSFLPSGARSWALFFGFCQVGCVVLRLLFSQEGLRVLAFLGLFCRSLKVV